MGGLALIAQELGHRVTGSDRARYPPIGPMLESHGIVVLQGYDPAHLEPAPDLVIVGNALSRGNPSVEAVLNRRLPYVSGPQWLRDAVLGNRRVIAVAGTHGKTTTSSIVAWLLASAGADPGFLIGGMPGNFDAAARLGGGEWFVIEADEYDTAFFDKRSKFLHYRPQILIVTNIEFDHADIFPDLAAIQRQFHHLVRTVPGNGLIVCPTDAPAVSDMLALGCWTPRTTFGTHDSADWRLTGMTADAGGFAIAPKTGAAALCRWNLYGRHNAINAAAGLAAAVGAGVDMAACARALAGFRAPKRRLELLSTAAGIHVYDDFAHHPTAISATLAALRGRVGAARIIAVLEPRSNTMRLGVQRDAIAPALADAERSFLYQPADLAWDLATATAALGARGTVYGDLAALEDALLAALRPGDHVLIMSNGDFGGLPARVCARLAESATRP
jgi:UDP-N-acetylmuramate: L-alanyl-gamma-D-glutamyl-meso-diaminopimelate ligase